jgi:pimeloyl-ACP methyl ester carboxylesterase
VRRPSYTAAALSGFLLGLCVALPVAHAQEAPRRTPADELVVLVHGMGRTSVSMMPLEYFLRRQGFDVLLFGYSSYGPTIAQIGDRLRERVAETAVEGRYRKVHFVGHSLGNIVIRRALQEGMPVEIGRFVMLAPPNQGARSADRMAPYFSWLLHPLPELQTEGSTVRGMSPPEGVEFAVIAAEDDGKVSIEETRLEGAAEHLVLPGYHTFLPMDRAAMERTARFLRTGSLQEPEHPWQPLPGMTKVPIPEPPLRDP